MSFQFASPLSVRTIGTNGVVPMGSYIQTVSDELKYITAFLLKVGNAVGNETLQMRVHTSLNFDVIYDESNEVEISDFSESENYIGWLRFDFNRKNMIAGQRYHLSLKARNYTEILPNTFYIATVFDTPFSMNDHADSHHYQHEYAKAFKVFGYR